MLASRRSVSSCSSQRRNTRLAVMISFAAMRFISGFMGDAALGISSQPVQFLGDCLSAFAVHGDSQEGGTTTNAPAFLPGAFGVILFCGVCVGFHGCRMKIPRQTRCCRGVDCFLYYRAMPVSCNLAD